MRPAASPDDFVRDPVGRWLAGRSLLVWCAAPDLRGSVYWGRPDEADVQVLVRTLEIDRGGRFDVVTDGRALAEVPAAVFDVLEAYIRSRMPGYSRHFRKHAIVHGRGLAGTAMTGFYPMLGPDHPWRPFVDPREAYAWLGRSDGVRVCDEVERIVERLRGVPPALQAVRARLAARPEAADPAAVARALGLSVRSLQRRLRAAGTSFRDELHRARVEAARRLLAASDEKLEAIARRVGYASRAQFAALFRRLTGETPARFRQRQNGL